MFDINIINSRSLIALPEVYMVLSLLIMIFYGIFSKAKADIIKYSVFLNRIFYFVVIVLVLTLILSTSIFYLSVDIFNNMFNSNPVIFAFKFVLILTSIGILFASKGYIIGDVIKSNYEYIIIYLAIIIGLSCLISSNDFISTFISMEFSSLVFYILSVNKKNTLISNKATLKYFILSIVTSALFLYGVSFIYGFTGSTNFANIESFFTSYGQKNILLDFAIILIITAMAFKLSLAPFHMWTIDVYSDLRYSSTLILNTIFKLCFCFILVKILWGPLLSLIYSWQNIIYILAIASIVVGYIGAIYQKNFMKIIAYSSVAQMGFAAMVIMFKSNFSLISLLIFLTTYVVSNVGLFTIIMHLKCQGRVIIELDDFKDLCKEYPFQSFMMSVFILSMAGIPPLGGFFGKLFIIYSVISNGYLALGSIAVIMTLCGMFFYIRIIKYIYTPSDHIKMKIDSKCFTHHYLLVYFCAIFLIGFIVFLKPLMFILTKIIIYN